MVPGETSAISPLTPQRERACARERAREKKRERERERERARERERERGREVEIENKRASERQGGGGGDRCGPIAPRRSGSRATLVRVWCSGFGAGHSGFGVSGVVLRVEGPGHGIWGLGFRFRV